MRGVLLVLIASAAGACSGGTTAGAPDGGAGNEALADPDRTRCVIGEAAHVTPPGQVEAPWMVRAPGRPRLVSRLFTEGDAIFWTEGAVATVVPDAPPRVEHALAWAGARYVATAVGPTSPRVDSFDASFGDRRPVHVAFPGGACDLEVTEMAGRALLTWYRPIRGACGEGPAWLQVLGATGEPLGAARALSSDRGQRVNGLHARWDFGRVVVAAADRDLGPVYWVLDPSGVEVSHGPGRGVVACPRSGCVYVRSVSEANGSTGEAPGAATLALEPLTGSGAFTTNAVGGTVTGLAVSGDRLLVLHAPASETVGGCDLTVIDVARRAVVVEAHDDSLQCDDGRARPTPRGFVLAGLDNLHGNPATVFTRTIDCSN